MRLLWLSGAYVTGSWIGHETGGGLTPPIPVLALWSVGALLLVVGRKSADGSLIPPLVVLLVLFGVARISIGGTTPPSQFPEALADEGRVEIEAVLLAEPRPYGDSTRLPLTVLAINDSVTGVAGFPQPVKVDVLADRLFDSRESLRGFRYGDRYRVTGTFQTKPGGPRFPPGISGDAVGVLTSASVRLVDSSAGNPARRRVADLRGAATGSILRTVGGDASGLATAITTGDRSHLSARMKDWFREAGLSHLLAISGLHVAIIAGLGLSVAAKLFGRRRQLYLVVPLGAVWIYALMAGMSPSVVRAGIMAAVYLLAIALGRQRTVVPAIALAGAAMILVHPETVVSLSFQMSFAAVLGIALLEPKLRGPMDSIVDSLTAEGGLARPPVAAVSRGLGYSLAATLATLPLVGSTFNQVPVFGAVATVVALPAVPVLIVSSLLVAAIEPVWSGAAAPVGWVAWLSAQWLTTVSRFFSDLPGATISTQGLTGWVFVGWYGALITWLNWRSIPRIRAAAGDGIRSVGTILSTRRAPGWRAVSWAIVPVLVVAALPWIAVAQLPGERLSVTFFETDRGDMILIETPDATQVLVDGGRDADGAARALGESLPFWDRSLDLVVLTHSDADHVGGLVNVLDRYEVGAVIDTTGSAGTDIFGEWRERLDRFDGPVIEAATGMVIDLGADAVLEVIWAGSDDLPESNANSTVMMLRMGGARVLLTGDMPRSVEERLVASGTPVEAQVLKAAHHGSDTSSSSNFLRAVDPSLIVVPVGERNPFGHPDEEVMERFIEHTPGATVLVTKDHGDVTVETDGERLWVRAERQEESACIACR